MVSTVITGRGADRVPPGFVQDIQNRLQAGTMGLERMGKLSTQALAYEFCRRVRDHPDAQLTETHARVTSESRDVVAIAGDLPPACLEYERGGVPYQVFDLAAAPVGATMWRLAAWGETGYRLTVYIRKTPGTWRRYIKNL